jgi:hypothetical protein
MKVFSYVVSSAIVMCGLVSIDLPASAVATDITGTWEVTFHTPPPNGDLSATFVLNRSLRALTATRRDEIVAHSVQTPSHSRQSPSSRSASTI